MTLLFLFLLATASAEPDPPVCADDPSPGCVEGAVQVDPSLLADTEPAEITPIILEPVEEIEPAKRTWMQWMYDLPVDALFFVARMFVRPEHVDDGALSLMVLLLAGVLTELRHWIGRRFSRPGAATGETEDLRALWKAEKRKNGLLIEQRNRDGALLETLRQRSVGLVDELQRVRAERLRSAGRKV